MLAQRSIHEVGRRPGHPVPVTPARTPVPPAAAPLPARAAAVDDPLAGQLRRAALQRARTRPLLQRAVVISGGAGGGRYTSANVRALLDSVAAKVGDRTVRRGPLSMVHSPDTFTFATLDELADYMTAWYAVAPTGVGRPAPALVYGAAHGDYHFTGKVTEKKAQWTLSKGQAQTLMETEIGKHIGRLMSESNASGWQSWYVGGNAGRKIGETVAGDEQMFCMQVQVNVADNVISYHGYPDQRLLKTGAGKSKSSISGGD